jgi:GT2 family glycosyltransferase
MWRKLYKGENGPKRIFGANAAAIMVSREFIEKQPFNDFFDTTLFMYLEDVDVNARATVAGWDNYLVPGTQAYHMGSASSNKRPGFSLYMTYRNNIAVLCKNIPLSLLVKMLPDMVRSDYHTMRHLRRTGRKIGIYYLLKGRIIGFIRLPLFIPGIWKMRDARKSISKEYLWQLMKHGD